MQVKHHYLCFTAFTCVLHDVWFMIDFVNVPALMEWFRKGAANTLICRWNFLTRGFTYISLNVIMCNILQKHKNKYMYFFFFASPEFTRLWSILLIYTSSVSTLMSFMGDYNMYSTDILSFLKKNKHTLSISSENSTATINQIITSLHYSTLYQEIKP